ncbi:DUF5629 family protein [Pseudomonas typographi]|uniref:DUF5629 family protein n=1 Tax=Pseudomonas typographi TaxID=2715964 RepID=A0ABR7Z6U5_9PSED|nr:DUF5629 family protein [Pseudomonas typographi]MBD1553818.1 DUF5629 family protein [Pseudomonas typographi]MBD1588511.1 DUF5629 family protein [Pseudomonas typographi]MBD1601213.1 DUF5629 family protein [Pseudomonas typographi]
MPLLSDALQTADMLLIDDLHAFSFSLDEKGLSIECMDGRELKRWHFVPEAVSQARYDDSAGLWLIDDVDGPHRLACMDAIIAAEEENE